MPGCETQPTWSEIRCRRTDPGQYDRFTRKAVGDGISFVLGWKQGKSEVQSVRFSKSKGWTLEKARDWMREHPKMSADEAMGIKNLAGNGFTYERRIENADGTVTYKDAVLLAEGTWTDGVTKTTVFYPATTIEKYQNNWVSDLYTLNHGNSPLDIIGRISQRRFANGQLLGDITFHMGTNASREAEWLVRHGYVDGNSVEVATRDIWDEIKGVYRADKMEFQRASLVINPACSVCRLSEGKEGCYMEGEEDKLVLLADVPWESVDKSKLPASAFAYVPDPEKRSTWKLPYRNPDGSINCNGVRAALQAIGGARTGKPMDVPASVKEKLERHMRACQKKAHSMKDEINNIRKLTEVEDDKMGECPKEQQKKLQAKAEELEKKLTEAESKTKQLQEKSEKLSQEYDELKSLAEAKDKEISELKAEIEKLKKEPVIQSNTGSPGASGELKYHSDITIRDGEIYHEA